MIYHWIYNSFDTQQLHQPHLSFKLPPPTKTNNNQKQTVAKKIRSSFRRLHPPHLGNSSLERLVVF